MDVKVKPQNPLIPCIVCAVVSVGAVSLMWLLIGPPPSWIAFPFAASVGAWIPYWQSRDEARGCAKGLVAADQIARFCKGRADVERATVDLGGGSIAYEIREEGDDESA